jgi:diaminopimelate decarboxylase
VAEWSERVTRAVGQVGTPCYVSAWAPVAQSLDRLEHLNAGVPLRCWLSFKTHPLPALALQWIGDGYGVEVVSERELRTALDVGVSAERLLVNGIAKHAWLSRTRIARLRVHFDSLRELDELLPVALECEWRVGLRLQVPDQRDARDPNFRDQFGMSRAEALAALRLLQSGKANLESVHFHLGQRALPRGSYVRAVNYAADICDEAGFDPWYVDCGGALPGPTDDASTPALCDLEAAFANARKRFPALREIWTENGRFMTEHSSVLAVSVLDIKEREDSRYLICDGGRTNHALAADARRHPLLVLPARDGGKARLTTVCGPTCMSDDRLGRWLLTDAIDVGDVIVWLEAGAYHLPWETRFSHGLCPIVWFDGDEHMAVARPRERTEAAVSQERVAT